MSDPFIPADVNNPAMNAVAVTLQFIAGEISRFGDDYGDMWLYVTALKRQVDRVHDGFVDSMTPE